MTLTKIEIWMAIGQAFLIENAILIAAVVLGLWALSSLALTRSRHRDPRVGFLADFLDISPDNLIPLPPGNALWLDYVRRNPDATAESHFPAGAPTLQGAYLANAHGGMTVIAVHNFDDIKVYADPEEPELADFLSSSLDYSGRLAVHRYPVEIEQDLSNRTHIVEHLLKIEFGYPGNVRAITLLRDDRGVAPEQDTSLTHSGQDILRATFKNRSKVQAFLEDVEKPLAAPNPDRIRAWFTSYAGRQTGRLRITWRLLLLAGCLALLALGQTGITDSYLSSIFGAPRP